MGIINPVLWIYLLGLNAVFSVLAGIGGFVSVIIARKRISENAQNRKWKLFSIGIGVALLLFILSWILFAIIYKDVPIAA